MSRVAKRENGAREVLIVFGSASQALSVGCVGWGRGLIIEQGRVGAMKSRGIRGVVSWCPLRSGEHSATANRVEQQLASRSRADVRSK